MLSPCGAVLFGQQSVVARSPKVIESWLDLGKGRVVYCGFLPGLSRRPGAAPAPARSLRVRSASKAGLITRPETALSTVGTPVSGLTKGADTAQRPVLIGPASVGG